jgi:hypothetical protein
MTLANPEDFCDWLERLEAEARVNPGFGTTGDEEFDTRHVIHVAGKHGKDGGGRFFVSALVQGVDDDEGRSFDRPERANDELLHLNAERLPPDVMACLQGREQLLPKEWKTVSELERKSGEDGSKAAPIFGATGTEEGRSELPIGRGHLRKRLGDG